MCVVSNLGDQGRRTWEPYTIPYTQPVVIRPDVSKEEIEALRRDVAEMKELLIAAKKIDKRLGLADCEMEDKVAFLKAFAALLDVDLSEVFDD